MGIALVHHFHPQVGTVDDVSPSVDHVALSIHNGVVEVEPVEVEGHGADPQCGEPDTDHRPSGEEEVQRAAVVEAGILEDQATEVTVGRHDVVGLFLLTEFVTVVLRLGFGGLTDQAGGHQ